MRKVVIVCAFLLFILTGCNKLSKEKEERVKTYENYINTVVNNKGIESNYIPFEYKMNVIKQKDKSYRYEIEISNSHVAMYDIEAIAVDQHVDMNENVFPCVGILEEDDSVQYNMIPYQSRGEKNFVKSISLDAVSKEEQFTINVMVTWKDSSLQNQSRVFFNCNYAQDKNDTANGLKETSNEGKNNIE